MRTTQVLKYLWACPATCVGLAFVMLTWLSGGRSRVVSGVIEAHGGLVTRLLTVNRRPWAAITLGHVVLGRNLDCLESTRAHERVHVRQYERWGLFFFPAYLLASMFAWLCGRDPYIDNSFEREAYGCGLRGDSGDS